MRSLLALTLAFLPLVYGQDSLLKSVELRYDEFNPNLATDFDTASASVRLTVAANGKPFALASTVPLPMAVVMALKDYEFRPQAGVSHVATPLEGSYEVTMTVPIRRSKAASGATKQVQAPAGISSGLVREGPQPVYPEYARHHRIQGMIVFQAVISTQGDVKDLNTWGGQFVLIQAAYDAIRQWKYRPYLLDDEPVEVLTNIDVNFPSGLLTPLSLN